MGVCRAPRSAEPATNRDGEVPNLKGQIVKAASARCRVPYILDLQRRATVAFPAKVSKHALKVIESLSAAYNVMYHAEHFLSADQVASLSHGLRRLELPKVG